MKNESNCFHKKNKVSKFLYGCRICTCCWSGTVFHEERHWWFQTISCSGLSWIHSSKRWWIITTKRMDSGKYKNRTRIGNHDQLSMGQTWNWNQNPVLWEKIILILVSEFLMDQINSWLTQIITTEILAYLPEEHASQSIVKVFAAKSKAKGKPQRREPVDLPSIIPMNERKWIDIEPGESSLSAYEISKKVIKFFLDILKQYNEKTTEQFNSEEVRIVFGINFHNYFIGQTIVGKYVCQKEEWKEDISTALIFQEHFFISEPFKDIQDVISLILLYRTMLWFRADSSNLFTIFGCAFNLHSIINSELIPGGQNSSKRQTVLFFLPIDPRDKDHKDPEYIDFSLPRRAQYMHSAWKKHQDAVFWVDINLAIQKGLTFYQTTIECNYSSRDTSSLLHSKSWKIEHWRSFVWKTIFVSSTATKDLIETRSQLDQRESSIGFYSWSTARR